MCEYQDIDATLFIKCNKDKVTYLITFVDDMLIIGNSNPIIKSMKDELSKNFEISDVGLMRYYLGVEIL